MKRSVAKMVALVALVAPTIARGQQPDARELVARANEAYRQGQYEAALEAYNKAEVALPESPRVAYNQGLTHYQMGDYAAARNHFNRALLTRDLDLEAAVKYNLGNVAYASALQKMSAPQEAIELLQQSISHYRDALELNPRDEDAQANIQTAQLMIKDLLDKLKQQQEQQQQNQDQQDQQQQQDSSQPQQGDQGKQDQDKQQQGDQEQQPDGEPQPGDQPDGQQQQEPQEAQADDQEAQQAEAREMSREEAERLLQSVRDRERQRREEQARSMRVHQAPVRKDW